MASKSRSGTLEMAKLLLGIFCLVVLIGCSGGGDAQVQADNAAGTENAKTMVNDQKKMNGGTRASGGMAPGEGRTGGAPPPVNAGG